jgi:hypothetical protein
MVMDSLRYWVEECHVDGFRFDLATTLGRDREDYSQHAVFLEAVRQDPVLSGVKLIAEPWDTGPSGYQVGNFPPGWAEWNDAYRDTVRGFWKGDGGLAPRLAGKLLGSADVFAHGGRRPWASVNFVTAHDGFTLMDLVSYNDKHNEANGEDNRDGHSHNLSWNCGAEGETDDPEIIALRDRQRRNLMATLLLSQGTPMILMGDETGAHAGRQQQRLLPGQRDRLDGLERGRPVGGVRGLRARPHRDPEEPRPDAGRPLPPRRPRPARAALRALAEGGGRRDGIGRLGRRPALPRASPARGGGRASHADERGSRGLPLRAARRPLAPLAAARRHRCRARRSRAGGQLRRRGVDLPPRSLILLETRFHG